MSDSSDSIVCANSTWGGSVLPLVRRSRTAAELNRRTRHRNEVSTAAEQQRSGVVENARRHHRRRGLPHAFV